MKLSSYQEARFRFWSCVYKKYQASEFLKLFYLKFFLALAGRRCVSADSAAREADALINIGAEHAPGRCAPFWASVC